MRGVPQDPEWHPEGDVWVHTLMVLDAAATLRGAQTGGAGTARDWVRAPGAERPHDDGADDPALMLGALCHDLGKPTTTERIGGRIRSHGHDVAGVAPTRTLLGRMRAPGALTDKVAALVEHHLAPALFIRNEATAKGYRRLARKLGGAGAGIELLVQVARADHLGRTTDDAKAGRFDAGDAFLAGRPAPTASSMPRPATRSSVGT